MKKDEIIKFFGGVRRTARALDYSPSYVCGWSDELPKNVQHRVQVFTNNHFTSCDTGRALKFQKRQ